MPVVLDNVGLDVIPFAGPLVPQRKLSPLEGAFVLGKFVAWVWPGSVTVEVAV